MLVAGDLREQRVPFPSVSSAKESVCSTFAPLLKVDMPVFVEDPTQFSKQRLKSVLISHNVELPPGENKKEVYLDLYMKHVWNKSNADFSSDDEDQAQNGTVSL